MNRVGPYRLDVQLGVGGMAEVWLATRQESGQQVALKLLKVSSPELFREARAHARLSHDHIVRLYDYGEDGKPFLSMERMDGTLRDLLPLKSFEQFRDVLNAVLSGLAFAHARGVIHRDIKPENILYRRDGDSLTLKLADFGIAHALGESALNQDMQASAGTPLYMAPEQFFGDWRDLGPWTDIYAVGCLAIELMTGRPPFQGSNLPQLAFKHLQEAIPRDAKTLFPVPAGLWDFVELLSEKQAGARVSHAADAMAYLGDFAAPEQNLPEISAQLPTLAESLDTLITENLGFLQTEPSVASFSAEPEPEAAGKPTHQRRHLPPRKWNGPTYRHAQLDTDGLGLFALREIPVVGLDSERDALWLHIVKMCSGQSATGVWLQSENDDTAWRLAEQVATHAAQIGAVQVFEITVSPTGGVREGLVGLAETLLRVWRARPEVVMQRSQKFGAKGETLGREILGRVHGQPDLLPGRTDKFGAVAELLREYADARPVVLLVRGVEYDEDLLDWLELIRNLDAPIQVFACGQPAKLPESFESLRVPGMDTESARGMLRAMLPFSEALSDEIARISGQDGEFAHQMVSDLVDRRALQVDGDRLSLPGDELLPTTPEDLFMRRLDRVLREMGHDAMTAEVALEIAAALGTAPEPNELLALCKVAKVPFPEKLIRTMLDRGLLRGDEARWYFAHPALLRCVKQRAEARGRWTTWHLHCAEHLLVAAHPDMPSEMWSRIGRHFVEAKEARRALRPMYHAVTHQTGSLRAAKLLIEQRQQVLLRAEIALTEPDAILQRHLQAVFQHQEGGTAQSIALLESVIENCKLDGEVIVGFEFAYAEILKSLGTMLMPLDPEMAGRRLDEAQRGFARLGLKLESASCAYGLGFIAMNGQNQTEAEHLYRKAADGFRDVGSRRRRAQVLSYLAHCLTSQGRHKEASDILIESVALARQLHDRYSEFLAESAHSTMLRHTDDFEGARIHAQSALSLAQGLGAQERAVATYNSVVLHLVDDPEAYIAEFEHVLELYASCEMKYRVPVVRLALEIAQGKSVSQISDLPKGDSETTWLLKIRARRAQHEVV